MAPSSNTIKMIKLRLTPKLWGSKNINNEVINLTLDNPIKRRPNFVGNAPKGGTGGTEESGASDIIGHVPKVLGSKQVIVL